MSTELTTQNNPTPFTRAMNTQPGVNVGAVSIESERAIAEARGQMQLARMFKRDLNAAYSEVLDACKIPEMAEIAFYSVPQGGQKVTGPSIKLMQMIAAACEHFEWGHRELSRTEATAESAGRSEVEVVAWDKQKNNVSKRQITILHVRDTKDGPRRLRDQRDIDNHIANVASKQMRSRLQALLPPWLVEAAIKECQKTLSRTNDEPISSRVRNMTQAFSKFGVNDKHLTEYLGHPLDATTLDELIDLIGIFNAVKEGAKASEFFISTDQANETGQPAAAKAIADASASTKKTTASVTAKPKPAASKPAEKQSNPVIDEAPARVEEPAQAEADQTVRNADANPLADADAANEAAAQAATASNADEDNVF